MPTINDFSLVLSAIEQEIDGDLVKMIGSVEMGNTFNNVELTYSITELEGRPHPQLVVLETIQSLSKKAIAKYVEQATDYTGPVPERTVEGVTAEAKQLLRRMYNKYVLLWNERNALSDAHETSKPAPLPSDEGWDIDNYLAVIEEYASYIRDLQITIAQLRDTPDDAAVRLDDLRTEFFPETEDQNAFGEESFPINMTTNGKLNE
jgi:hypothetical protein